MREIRPQPSKANPLIANTMVALAENNAVETCRPADIISGSERGCIPWTFKIQAVNSVAIPAAIGTTIDGRYKRSPKGLLCLRVAIGYPKLRSPFHNRRIPPKPAAKPT